MSAPGADAPAPPSRRPSFPRPSVRRLRASLADVPRWELAAVAGITLVALLLRVWNLGQNLPLVYNIDESARFVPDAAGFFTQRLGYRELVNPPGMMGLLGVVDQVWFGVQGLSPTRGLAEHPTQAYMLGRVLAALMGTAAVPLLHLAGRRLLGRTAGLVAAGILAVAFLPVAYSRVALSDGPTIFFLVLGILAAANLLRDGRVQGYVLAGLAVGLAAGFKYNAGIVLVVALAAVALRIGPDGVRTVVRRTVVLGLVALTAFVVADPYAVISPHEMWRAIEYQANWSSNGRYVGEPYTNGFAFYAWSATWGVGWIPTVAAVLGAVLLAVRRPRIALVLLPMVALYLLVMGPQDRFFARWILPVVPVMALAAGFLVQDAAGLLRDRRFRIALVATAALALGAQSLVHSAHMSVVVGQDDTRTLLRAWLTKNVPLGRGVVVESMSPKDWAPFTTTGDPPQRVPRWQRYQTIAEVKARDSREHPQLRRKAGFSSWTRILYPGLVDVFERYGYCYVTVGSYQAGRAARTPGLVPQAVAYYRELAKRGRLVWQASPFGEKDPRYGPLSAPVKYQIDRQGTTYELDYHRPGPIVSVYRLSGGRCAAQDPGPPVASVPAGPSR